MDEEPELSHLTKTGEARMVDVSAKDTVAREAVAEGMIRMQARTVALLREGRIPKGDVLATARIAGIQAAKRTWDLIPLCHQLPLSQVKVAFAWKETGIGIQGIAKTRAQTGVEMEALTAVSVAALTLYDMCKAVDQEMEIGDIRLVEKRKEESGT
ncbi:MAG: cyclic pyranopterin monophosphate synthase MoaC [Verrucomicrobiota bacterium]